MEKKECFGDFKSANDHLMEGDDPITWCCLTCDLLPECEEATEWKKEENQHVM